MPTVTWNPLVQQVAEADTLYMFDADAEKLLTPGAGGLIMANAQGGDVPWTGTSKVRDVPGKFLRGVHCYVRSNGFLYMPMEGLIGADEFTIEFFIKGDVSWANAVGANLFALSLSDDEQLSLDLHQNVMVLRFFHYQSTTAANAVIVYTPTPTIPIGQWVSIGITFAGGALKLYVDSTLVGSATGVGAPRLWASSKSGMQLLGFNGGGADSWSFSDLRISRKARVPGVPLSVDNLNTLTVTPATATGATINQKLLGGLLTLDGTATEVMATTPTQAITGLRSGKYLSTAPIKAGGTDGAHPTAGISGQWSYDWRVADRTFAYHDRLGVDTIGDMGSTPTLLGGDQVPYSGAQLTNDVNHPSSRCDWANYCNIPPNNNTQWAQMVRDLVHHTKNELGHPVPYWSVWNEPNGSGWNGTQAQFHAMYAATVAAIKQVDPTAKVGGPELEHFATDWVQNLIQYCAANGVPLDFISWHHYLGNIGDLQRGFSQIAQWAAQYGLSPVPKIVVGEWCWSVYNFYSPTKGFGVLPWRNYQYHRNDWGAAWDAWNLMEMQRLGALYGVYTSPVAMDGEFGVAPDGVIEGWDASGLMSHTAPWAGLNVFRQWNLMKPTVVSSSYAGQPGVTAVASKDGSGLVTIMVSHLRYRKDVTPSLKIQLPSGYSGAPVTHYIVDDAHSNPMDAGAGHEDLETISSSAIDGSNSLTVSLPPRSSHVFVVGTPAADVTPPQTTITVAPTNGTATSVSFSFVSNEPGSTFEGRLDGGSYATIVSPKVYSGLSVGSHTFDVRAIDPASNVDASPASYTWQVTTAGSGGGGGPPVTAGLVLDIDPGRIIAANNDPVEASDFSGLNHHAVQATGTKRPLLKTNVLNGLPVLRFDGTDDILQTASFTLPQPAHVFIVAKYNSAQVGNDTLFDGQAPDSRMRVWRTATGLTMYAQSGTIDLAVADVQTTFHFYEFLYDDAGAGSKAREDGGTAVTGTVGTAVPSGLTLGSKASGGEYGPVDVARVLVYNVALGTSDRIAIESFLNNTYFGAAPGDTTPPVTTITSTPPNSTSQSATLVFSANEPSTFETNLDGAAWVASSSPKSYNNLAVGQHTFQVRATDIAGNLETTPKTHTWTISAPSPQTSVTSEELWLTDSRIGMVMNDPGMQGDKFQTALDLALSDASGYGVLRLNPGFINLDREPSYPRSSKILHIVGSGASEDGTSGSVLRFPTDLGTGKFAFKTSEIGANQPIQWSHFTIMGPNTNNAYGADMSDMWGPKLFGRSDLDHVNVIYFKTGILAVADHHDFNRCNFSGNSYGLYFGENQGQGGGDFTFTNVKATGCRKASIGIGTTQELGGFTFIQGHFGFSPIGIHRVEEGGTQRHTTFLAAGDFINSPFEACGPHGVIWDEPGDGWISDVRLGGMGTAGEAMFTWPGKPAARGLWDLGGVDDVEIFGDIAPWFNGAIGLDKPMIYATSAILGLRCHRAGFATQLMSIAATSPLLTAPKIEEIVIGREGARAGGLNATVVKSDGALARYDAVELVDIGGETWRARKARNANPYIGQVVAPTVDGDGAYIITHGSQPDWIKARVTSAVRVGQTLVVDPSVPGNLKPGGTAFGAGTVARAVLDIAAGAVGPVKIINSQAS